MQITIIINKMKQLNKIYDLIGCTTIVLLKYRLLTQR